LKNINDRFKTLSNHAGVRKYFFNTGWMFGEKVLRLIAALFIGAYVARYLGPAQYGLLNYVISLVSLFSVLASFGIEGIVIRELIKDDQKRDTVLGTAFFIRLTGAIIIFLLLVAMNELTDSDRQTKNMILIIGAGAFVEIFGVIDYFFQSKVWSKYVVWSQMIALSVVSIFRIILILNDAALVWFAWSSVVDFFVLALGLIFFYTKNGLSLFSWKFDSAMVKSIVRASWPMIFSSLSITIYMKIDQVMIKWMLGDEANGNYGVAVRLSETWNFIPMAICASLFPAILNAKMVSEEKYLKRLQRLYDLMVLLSLAIAIPMSFLSSVIVRFLFGDAYTSAGPILSLYIWSSVFTFLGVANGKWILSENLQVYRMICLSIAAVMNIVLNYILIPAVGIYGAAIATLISYAFATYFSLLYSSRTRPMFISGTRSFNVFAAFKRLLDNS
jgi:O-antigen/teichoic acid export membrane protein